MASMNLCDCGAMKCKNSIRCWECYCAHVGRESSRQAWRRPRPEPVVRVDLPQWPEPGLAPEARDYLYPGRAVAVAARLAGANIAQLRSRWKAPNDLILARWAAMRAMRNRGLSAIQIGQHLHRDHSTVLHGLKRFDEQYPVKPRLREFFEQVDRA